jgi:hypothetical protein
MEALGCVNAHMDLSHKMIELINALLSPSLPKGSIHERKTTSGNRMDAVNVIKSCTLGDDNVLRLPDVQLDKKTYGEVKSRIEKAGGHWVGGKVFGFVFDFDPHRVVSALQEGKEINLQQDYQFFETPDSIADRLVSIAGGINAGHFCLEPSAGRGALIRAILKACPVVEVDYLEAMPENRDFLAKAGLGPNVHDVGEDFLNFETVVRYDRIIANPPFSGNQDVIHVRRMYEFLRQGGTLAAITSCHWLTAKESRCVEFREWTKRVNASIFDIEEGAFKSSGTNIRTVAVVITK